MEKIDIYTDGACSVNPGPGGWAAILIYRGNEKEISGYEPDTTNNRMELLAAIRAMETLKTDAKFEINIYSDSKYLVDAFNEKWVENWQKNDWRGAGKKPVKNRDLWERLIELNIKYTPKFYHVRGHADNPYNNRCDELAVLEYTKRRD